jgi:hypothetical protein
VRDGERNAAAADSRTAGSATAAGLVGQAD